MEKIENCPVTYYSEVLAKSVDWLWYPYIPFGKITIIQGDPGEGKTSFALQLAAQLSNGSPMPDGNKSDPVQVIYQNGEDSAADTIKPRLERMDADCNRIAFIPNKVSLCDAHLEEAIRRTGARLLVLDPLQAFIPEKHNMSRAGDMRNALGRLAKVAEETNCAVLIVGHMTKSASRKGLYRGLGSIDIAATARSILLIGRPEEDSNFRIIVHVKSNLAPRGNSMSFTFDSSGKFCWQELDVEYTVQDLLGTPKKKKHNRAEEILLEILEKGEALATDIYGVCSSAGLGKRTVDQAKKDLGIRSIRKDNRWFWQL